MKNRPATGKATMAMPFRYTSAEDCSGLAALRASLAS